MSASAPNPSREGRGTDVSLLLVLVRFTSGEGLDLAGRLRITCSSVFGVWSTDGRGLERDEAGWLRVVLARLGVVTGGGMRAAESRFGRGGGTGAGEVVVVPPKSDPKPSSEVAGGTWTALGRFGVVTGGGGGMGVGFCGRDGGPAGAEEMAALTLSPNKPQSAAKPSSGAAAGF